MHGVSGLVATRVPRCNTRHADMDTVLTSILTLPSGRDAGLAKKPIGRDFRNCFRSSASRACANPDIPPPFVLAECFERALVQKRICKYSYKYDNRRM